MKDTVRAPVTMLAIASCLFVAVTRGQAASQGAATLTVTVEGINSVRGKVLVALYQRPGKWLKRGGELTGRVVRARKGAVKVVFKNVWPGTYGVSSFHDENDNRKLDTNWLGIPQEGNGFSRDAKASFGPPKFESAAFSMRGGDRAIKLRMRY